MILPRRFWRLIQRLRPLQTETCCGHYSWCRYSSGMIHPLWRPCLIVTCDANISSGHLRLALSQNVEKTFNQITVDGDINQWYGSGYVKWLHAQWRLPDTEFDKLMLNFVMQELAKKIAKDGEGANKLIRWWLMPNALWCTYDGKIAVGPSVKTAIFGEDP